MTRFRVSSSLISLVIAGGLMACTSDAGKGADTSAAVTDTAAVTTAPPASTTPTASSTAGSGAPIVKVNINTATDAELLAIPGMGPRMLREFKEYRPYTSIEQFRREIGKYVDKAEVARFEQYITIK